MTEAQPVKYPRQKRWRDDNPEKVWAHVALQSAIRRGLVVPKPCKVCGEERVDAHHPDYSKPAEVEWLCRKHHKDAHRQEGGGNG